MFAKFDYHPTDYFYNTYLNPCLEEGQSIYRNFEKNSRDCLKKFIFDNGNIDGSSLKDHWFHVGKVDVFLSHSHKDINRVKAFAGWLNVNFGLTCFIDSCVWGYCDDLLKEIDNKYCKNTDGKTYDYQLRNYTTSHVHSMLSSALAEMIDNSECLIFFNTPNSISLNDEIKSKTKGQSTFSPWIYHELSMSRMIRSKKPERLLTENFSRRDSAGNEGMLGLVVEYDVTKYLKQMITLTDNILLEWKRNHNFRQNALDELYSLVKKS